MNSVRLILQTLVLLATSAGLAVPNGYHAQANVGARPAIRLSSYEVVLVELKKPLVRRDSEGKEQRYDRAYLVTLKGDFPRDQAMAMELFIGDYRVPEYGGTKDGLYFRIYDQKLLEQLEGKEFRYRFVTREIKGLGVRFSIRGSPSLKVIKEQ